MRPIATPTAADANPRETRVWDPLVRALHWTLVLCFAAAYATGDAVMPIHRWAGYGVLAVVALRTVWGVVGTRHARFTDFVRGPRAIRAYLAGLIRGRPRHYEGHNPAGGAMVIFLLAGLAALGGTGWIADGVGFLSELSEILHEGLANLMLGAVVVHVLGVLVSSLLHRENLVRAMITGRKPAVGAFFPAKRVTVAVFLIALGIGTTGAAVAWVGERMEGQAGPGLPAFYTAACGDCHDAYHPSLRPAAAWRLILAGLDDHFGEDASLTSETTKKVEAFLTAGAADNSDTITAKRLRAVDPAEPRRMTALPYWRRTHSEIPDAVFSRKSIGSRVNCSACHRDADVGGFHANHIHIPADIPVQTANGD